MFNPFSTNITSVERLKDGSWFYELFNSKNTNKGYKSEQHKLETVLCNPAFLTIAKLQCDMFSLGKIKAVLNDNEKPNDNLVSLLKHPNPYQTDRQFLWDYMFWRMLGTAYLYTNSKVISDRTKMYWLNPANFVWDDKLVKQLDKLTLSNQSYNELERLKVEYKQNDGTSKHFQLSEIKPFFDTSNGFGNWYKGASTVDALYKIITNSETALDAKYSNLDFAGKFTVTGKTSLDNINDVPMGDNEQRDSKLKLKGKERVHVLKTPIEISRFVEDLRKMELDKSFFTDVYKIGKIYNIPKDVIEAYLENGSTYENQEKSKAGWIEQSIKPASEDLMNGIEMLFGYNEKNTDLVMQYKHLSFMHVFEKQKQESISREINNIRMAVEMEALSKEEANTKVKELLGYE